MSITVKIEQEIRAGSLNAAAIEQKVKLYWELDAELRKSFDNELGAALTHFRRFGNVTNEVQLRSI